MNELLEIIREQHGSKLKLKEEVYYLVINDAVICVSLDEEDNTIKIDVDAVPEGKTFVYFDGNKNLEDLI
jgi:hypothetical protein